LEAIRNPGPFRLQSTFGSGSRVGYGRHKGIRRSSIREVNLAANDRNAEILLCADHTESSYTYDDSGAGSSGGAHSDMKSNRSNLAITPDFEISINGNRHVYRAATQDVGRPWRRVAPTHETFTKTFADKTNDSPKG
jgi:hypothetical protein